MTDNVKAEAELILADNVKEAQLILSITDQKLRSWAYKDRLAPAARLLVQEFVAAARAMQGVAVSTGTDETASIQFGDATVTVRSYDGIIKLQRNGQGETKEARLFYDPASGMLVGEEADIDVALAPGKRRPRVYGLIVLAKLVSALLLPEPKPKPTAAA